MRDPSHVFENFLSFQECRIRKVVDYQCSKIHPEIRVGKTSTWFCLRIERIDYVFPFTPSLGSLFAPLPIWVSYQSIIGIDDALPGTPICCSFKRCPSLWENASDSFREPRHFGPARSRYRP